MKVAPHVVIETIRDPKIIEYWRTVKVMPPLVGLLARATQFDFGDLRPDQAHIDFGLDLLERGLFKLPYPVVAYSFEGRPDHIRMRSDKSRGGMFVMSQHDDASITAISCNEIVDQQGVTLGAIPIGVAQRATLVKSGDNQVDVTATTQAVVTDRVLTAMYGGTAEHAHDQLAQRVSSNLLQCIGLTVMLMSRGVDTERIAAPDRLNRARAAKKKPPIADRYVVKLAIGSTYAICQEGGAPDEDISGHKRGSPRVHWRRGHWRRLHRGTDAEVIIPIAPILVAAGGLSDQIVKRPEYKVSP